ncbi:MAG: hypothetical protein ACLFO1_10290 [Spirochaetaceae bacterium]
MKKALKLVALALAATVVLAGCYTTFASSNGKLAYGEMSGTSQGDFEVTEQYMWIIHPSLFTIGGWSGAEIDTVIEPELATMGANAVRNVQIQNGFEVIDLLLTGIVPVVSWSRYTVTGEAVTQ